MARVGEVVPRAPQGSDHGASAALGRLQAAVPVPGGAGGATPAPGAEPQGVAPGPPPAGQVPDQNGGYDAALFAPSDRTHEPITQGAPFGPGASFVPQDQESDRDFLVRVATTIESSPGASNQVKAFAAAVKSGR